MVEEPLPARTPGRELAKFIFEGVVIAFCPLHRAAKLFDSRGRYLAAN